MLTGLILILLNFGRLTLMFDVSLLNYFFLRVNYCMVLEIIVLQMGFYYEVSLNLVVDCIY